ncbi:hypothetical protein Y032_0314g2230 [Ancylostoma ceylanicum]|uniref:Uncharacterized protein n=1 Tax=Ancylostoma ceylanicum TaxID=53326 RepID=A0A016S2W6_9BILA|nr:hypothetical protein Y032_0314g2230 [Ancylostoma ceylanicum]
MLEIATYPGPSRHDNPSKVHQQAQKRRRPRSRLGRIGQNLEPGGGSLQAVLAARQVATLANESWRVRSIRSSASHVNSGQQNVKGPVLENRFKNILEQFPYTA